MGEEHRARVYAFLAKHPRAKLTEIIAGADVSKPIAVKYRRDWLAANPEAAAPQDVEPEPEGEEPAPAPSAEPATPKGPAPAALHEAFPPAEAPPEGTKPTDEQLAKAKGRTIYLRL